MPIPISANLEPMNGLDYFLIEDTYIRGGLRVVKTVENLAAINEDSLKPGAQVYLVEGNIDADGEVDTSIYTYPLAGGRNYVYVGEDASVAWQPIGSTFKGPYDERVAYGIGDFVVDEITNEVYVCIGPLPVGSLFADPNWLLISGAPSLYKGNWEQKAYPASSIVHHQGEVFITTFGAQINDPAPATPTDGSMTPWMRLGSSYRELTFMTGMWDTEFYYRRGSIVRDSTNMHFYVNMSDAGPSEVPPSENSNWVRISTYDSWEGSGVRYRSNFSSSSEYTDGNLVWFDQKLWLCTNGGAPTSEEPSPTSFYWKLISDSTIRQDVSLFSTALNEANSVLAYAVSGRNLISMDAASCTAVSIEGTDPQTLELVVNGDRVATIQINDGSDHGTVTFDGGAPNLYLMRGAKIALRTTGAVNANNKGICVSIACLVFNL